MNDALDVVDGDVSIRDGRIAAIGASIDGPHDRTIDCAGDYVLPGLIQTHIHLCQTLFRGYADDMPLMQWLRTRVWLQSHTGSKIGMHYHDNYVNPHDPRAIEKLKVDARPRVVGPVRLMHAWAKLRRPAVRRACCAK